MNPAFDAVVGYAFGTLDSTEDAEAERRLFEDPSFAVSAAVLLEMRDALREMAKAGPLVPFVTPAELAEIARTRRVLLSLRRETRHPSRGPRLCLMREGPRRACA